MYLVISGADILVIFILGFSGILYLISDYLEKRSRKKADKQYKEWLEKVIKERLKK